MADRHALDRLLAGMAPELAPEPYAYALGPAPAGTQVFASVAEDEGLTVVLTQEEAQAAGLRVEWVAARITLQVNSQLSDVGLTATVSSRLAARGISCNVIAGFFHDHLFVPEDRGREALEVLQHLVREASAE